MLSASKSGSGLSTGYNLTRSLRTRASASGYLNRTPSVAGSLTTWTWSGWVKRGTLGTVQQLFGYFDLSGGNNLQCELQFLADNTFEFQQFNSFVAAYQFRKNTAQVFRDPSAWYHIVCTYDSTNATAEDRARVYVNGTRVTSWANNITPALSQTSFINSNLYPLGIARSLPSGTNYFDGYIAEQNFIDGQALTPSSFGSTNALTGVWQPAKYTGTYGTNGFYLPFTDNSALTTSSNVGLGKDFSGNGNYWTTNNISITAGVTYDSMTDVPTLTSATAANFAVANPVDQYLCTIAQGNLNVTTNNGGYGGGVRSTIAVSSGKWYWESVITVLGGSAGQAPVVGIIPPTTPINAISSNTRYAYYGGTGNKLSSAGSVAYGAAFSTGDVIGYALDLDAGTLTFYKNNTSQGTAFTGLSGSFCAAVYDPSTGGTTAINFGQQPFTFSPPSGYVALNTFNLPTSTILAGNKVMDATLFTATSGANTITNAGGFKPDFVWTKSRSNVQNNYLVDSVRGGTSLLVSNSISAESIYSTPAWITSFNSNGYSTDTASMITTGYTYVGWQWQAGQGSTSSNTNGSITSTVSVNASAGFSIATFTTPSGFTSGTVGHGLGVAPAMFIVKNRTGSAIHWNVYHQSTGNTVAGFLDLTQYFGTSSAYWNNTSPTSSVFTIGSNLYASQDYVAYSWAQIAGYSSFGIYTGNGVADGPFVYTGFRPKFVMIKKTATGGGDRGWIMLDSSRSPYNVIDAFLYANASDAEFTNQPIDFLSNGFKIRTNGLVTNDSGVSNIYMAFAENPFKNSLAR
jgi:hypothetical protein